MSDHDIENQTYFEKYKAVKKLGQGSFGTVYQGVNIKTGESIAIKFVLNFLIHHPIFLRKLETTIPIY